MKPFRLSSLRSPSQVRFTGTHAKIPLFGPGLYEYNGGRFLFNEERRLQERRLKFNVHELANVICRTVGKPLGDLEAIERFAEGGFNRILQATFNDKREVLVRLPFRLDAPLRHSVASEAATLSFLRDRGIPVPSVLAYSASSDNPVGIEYIVLEKMQGQPLGDRWFSLENKAVAKIMKQIVDIERDYMALELPACGSLYFASDLTAEQSVPLGPALGGHFAVGPIASYAWEYRKNFVSCFQASARRELAFCQEHGKPRLNVELYLRELDNFELQSPSQHAQLLRDFLLMAPFLEIPMESAFARPTLRHPDLSPNNILVNDANDIVGIIDWQHSAILPLSLCAGIPRHFQNWGDAVSESLQKPETKLPADFESRTPAEQEQLREQMRRRLVHFYYAALSLKKVEDHFDAFRNQNSMLRAKIYARAGAPWEGSSLALEHALIEVQEHWPLGLGASSGGRIPDCPVRYAPERVQACLKRVKEEEEKLEELDDMRGMLGTDATGWVADDEHLAQAREMRETMRTAFLKECETDLERQSVLEHFPFDDHAE